MYTNILIATDGSELAQRGLDHGLALAKTIGAKVTVVTVTPPIPPRLVPSGSSRVRGNPFEAYSEQAEESAGAILKAAQTSASALGVQCEVVHISDMEPADGILACAKEKGCNLIVMTSHGRRGLERLLLGSQTVDVLTHSNIPVLVVR